MGVILSLLAAIVWGAADFCGGIATRRSPSPFPVVIFSQLAGFVLSLIIAPIMGGAPTPASFALALISGVAIGLGLFFLYRGLAIGRMGVVSPLSAVIAGVVPAFGAIAFGQFPSLWQWAGVGCAMLAVVLVSASPQHGELGAENTPPTRGIASAVAAGLSFGLFYLIVGAPAERDAGLYSLVAVRAGSVIFLIALALMMRVPLRLPRGTLRLTIGGGLLDMSANALYAAGTHFTILAVAAVLSSLYPAATVMLAAVLLRERLHPQQWAGVIVALGGVVLLAR